MPANVLKLLMKFWKPLAVLLLCIGSYLAGSLPNKSQETIVFKEKIVEKVVEVESKKTKNDKTTTINKKPDGSSTTVIVDRSESTETKEKETLSEKNNSLVSQRPNQAKKEHSIGFSVQVPISSPTSDKDRSYEIELGRRFIGNMWVTGSYTYRQHESFLSSRQHLFGIGLRHEF